MTLALLASALTITSFVAAPSAYASDITAPSTPKNLAWLSSTSTSVTLGWSASTDNVGIGAYDVYRDGLKAGSVSATSTRYTDTKLWPSSTHTYYVIARDTSGNSSPATAVITAFTSPDGTDPSTPASFTAKFNRTTLTVPMSWQASTDNVKVDHYVVYRDLVKIAYPTGTTFTDTSPPLDKAVKYFVLAVDEVGNISNSSNAVQLTTDDKAPTAPTNLRITSVTGSSVSLSWTASTDNFSVSSYVIYCNGVRLASQPSSWGTVYYSGGLKPLTDYKYRVAAMDPTGNISAKSDPVTTITKS